RRTPRSPLFPYTTLFRSQATENANTAAVTKLVEFRQGDLFEADISPATVVTLYLLPDVNLRLKPKLLRDLKPGTRIVSHGFDMRSEEHTSELQSLAYLVC